MDEKAIVSMQHRTFKRYCVDLFFQFCTRGLNVDKKINIEKLKLCNAKNCPALKVKKK